MCVWFAVLLMIGLCAAAPQFYYASPYTAYSGYSAYPYASAYTAGYYGYGGYTAPYTYYG